MPQVYVHIKRYGVQAVWEQIRKVGMDILAYHIEVSPVNGDGSDLQLLHVRPDHHAAAESSWIVVGGQWDISGARIIHPEKPARR